MYIPLIIVLLIILGVWIGLIMGQNNSDKNAGEK